MALPAAGMSEGVNAAAGVERLGTVAFATSCSAEVKAPFDRGVALLHDFWYEEARDQFKQILAADPGCAMAHWGVAMSSYQEIWSHPTESTMASGWKEMQQAQAAGAKTERERGYLDALSAFYQPGPAEYQARVEAYSAAMGRLYKGYPKDVDAGAFYALSLIAVKTETDTTLDQERKAMAVLVPLFKAYPDNPGVVHYIIHACDSPTMARQGLAAADHYGEIAPSGSHAVHMPGHIYARLGMWDKDIAVNSVAVEDSERALEEHKSGGFDQLHADDFLIYAYLQSGQEAKAKEVLDSSGEAIDHLQAMPDMGDGMAAMGMETFYRTELQMIYDLELRDWQAALALRPTAGAAARTRLLAIWARAVAAGHLKDAQQARDNFAAYKVEVMSISKGRHPEYLSSTSVQIKTGEIMGWTAYAEGRTQEALDALSKAADLQDKVGQGEVDIPAREMLADMLLALHRDKEARGEYDRALVLSPNRFNGLYGAGMAAEAMGDKAGAARYYAALLKSTGDGASSSRPELGHAKGAVGAGQVAKR